MKTAILAIVLLAALAPAAFADSSCERSCCEESGGTWDADYEWCEDSGGSYYTCVSDYCSSYGDDDYRGSVSCCGTGFILAAIGGAALFLRNA